MKTDNDMDIEDPVAGADAPENELEQGCGHFRECGGAVASAGVDSGSSGLQLVPSELVEFIRSGSVRDVVRALHLGIGTVHRLRTGYWPTDPRRLLNAWSAYKGRTGTTATRWVLRCVYPGGVVRQGRHVYTAQQLGMRVGELVAVARSVDGGLIVQPLELPLQRFALSRVEA